VVIQKISALPTCNLEDFYIANLIPYQFNLSYRLLTKNFFDFFLVTFIYFISYKSQLYLIDLLKNDKYNLLFALFVNKNDKFFCSE